jgi:hypothetical protein
MLLRTHCDWPSTWAKRTLTPLCSAAPPSSDRFRCFPKWSLWRWVVRALGQVLACRAHRHARPAGGGADVGGRREQGVLPEVVGLPQATSSSRSGSVPPWRAAAASAAYWSLLFCRPRKVHSGRNRSRSPSKGSGSARLALHQFSASAATWRNTSPGKVLSRGCRGASSLTSSKMSASRASPSSRARRAVTASSGAGRFLTGRHTPTVGQNHRSPGGLPAGARSFVVRFLGGGSPPGAAPWHRGRRHPPRHQPRDHCRPRWVMTRCAGWCSARTGPETCRGLVVMDRPAGPAVIHAMPMRTQYRRLLPKGRRDQA